MNTPLSNSVYVFDLVAAVDSEDSYHNLKTGIFDYYKTKLSALIDDSKPLSIFMVFYSGNFLIYCYICDKKIIHPS